MLTAVRIELTSVGIQWKKEGAITKLGGKDVSEVGVAEILNVRISDFDENVVGSACLLQRLLATAPCGSLAWHWLLRQHDRTVHAYAAQASTMYPVAFEIATSVKNGKVRRVPHSPLRLLLLRCAHDFRACFGL